MARIHGDRDVVIPTIHMNGSSAETLLKDHMAVYEAFSKAVDAMRHATPNLRDYYVQGEEAGQKARDQHAKRQELLAEMKLDIEAIIIGIQDQVDERDERRRKAGY